MVRDSFDAFGIKHLSPSSLNTFAAEPAMFVLTKVLGYPNVVGAAAHRGTASEAGIAHGLNNPQASLTECVEVGVEQFKQLVAMTTDPRKEKEQESIPGFIEYGLRELKPYGKPTSMQGEVRVEVPGLAVPLFGYYDFLWANVSVLVDLKTSHRLESEIKLGHARQLSLYKKAEVVDSARITYATPKKAATYGLENGDQHFDALVRIALTVQRFVSLSADPKELASLVIPDVDSFYYNDPLTRQLAFEVWGI